MDRITMQHIHFEYICEARTFISCEDMLCHVYCLMSCHCLFTIINGLLNEFKN